MPRVIPTTDNPYYHTTTFKYHALKFDTGGQNSYDCPPGQDPNLFERLTNVMPITRGSLERRWGLMTIGASTYGQITRIISYQQDSTLQRRLLLASPTGLWVASESGVNVIQLATPGTGAFAPFAIVSREWAYWFDGLAGELKKWNLAQSSTIDNWGIVGPSTAPAIGSPTSSGAVNLQSGRKYLVAFVNTTSNSLSDIGPLSVSSGKAINQNIPLSAIEVSSDPQVDQKVILATKDGGDASILYLVAQIPNSQTTYSDAMTEEVLLVQSTYLETNIDGTTIGVADNTPPPSGLTLAVKHQGRLVGVTGGQYLRFSKNMGEVTTSTGVITGNYEECWPAAYEMDISQGAERVTGLASDGTTLFVGTESHIRRVYGDGPANLTIPELAFNAVGVLNQAVWQVVYLEGTPMGMMWFTPDFKVVGSDFNAYQDVGAPIQDVLNTTNSNAATTAFATVVVKGPYSLYILGIPTGSSTYPNTFCVYDLKKARWFVWTFPFAVSAGYCNIAADGSINPLFATTTLYKLDPSVYTDNGAAIPVHIRSVWLDMDDPPKRKLVNEIEVLTPDPTNTTVTLEGASTSADFTTPSVIRSGAPLTQSPFGQWKTYFFQYPTKSRFYRISFNNSNITPPEAQLIDSYSLECMYYHTL